MRILPMGDRALLVELTDLASVLDLARRLAADRPAGVSDVVPAARTVLLRTDAGTDLAELAEQLPRMAAGPAPAGPAVDEGEPVVIPVRYDGPDLAEAARLAGLSPAELIAAHTGGQWRAAFSGFAPGFCYLTGDDDRLALPRRAESRTSVPAGSVALAGGFSAVYPRASPGGWQLIGSTDTPVWDVRREPPALLTAGRRVRFVDVTEDVTERVDGS